MIPEPRVTKVEPHCYQCGATDALIEGDGPVVCRPCIKVGVRLAAVGATRVRFGDPAYDTVQRLRREMGH